MSVGGLGRMIDAAQGRRVVDTLLINALIVDVYAQRVVRGRVAVDDGIIVGVFLEGEGDASHACDATETIDCAGRYLAPGLIDAHLHIESSSVRPCEYARMALAHGTTCAVADAHEIANVAGLEGLAFMLADAARAPLRVLNMMPSCVPALPDEQAGAAIDSVDMRAFLDAHPGEIFGLGEMMNVPGVLSADPETLARIDTARDTVSGLVDGHAPLVGGRDLNACAAAGIAADHECTQTDEALAKLSRGLYIMLREGTCSHDLEALAPLIIDEPTRARRCCLATDDRSVSDALSLGMIDNALRAAIGFGIDPVAAITMATLSAAELLGLDHGRTPARDRCGAIAPGRRADLLILDDLTFAEPPRQVFAAGEAVALGGRFTGRIEAADASLSARERSLRDSVRLPALSRDVFSYAFRPGESVIDIVGGSAITRAIHPLSAEGLRRIVVIERHGRALAAQRIASDGDMAPGTGLVGRHIGRGWVRGYEISGGAIASTVGHDSHNVLVVGDDADDMLHAAEAIGEGGFAVVRGGELAARVELPLGGLMSDTDARAVARDHERLVRVVREMGVKSPVDPIMGIIFLSLPVIPELRIRPGGMFDVSTSSYVR